MPTIRALTVDAAGTLIVPDPGVGAVYAEVAAAYGLVRAADGLERAFPAAFAATRARWGVPYGADDRDALRFWAAVIEATFAEPLPYGLVSELYDTFATARRWRVLPGARALFALAARRELPLAVVSNFDCRLEPLLHALELGPWDALVVSTAVGAAKPDPAPLHAACAVLNVAPAEVLHLGDSTREDGGMCAAAGARWLQVDPAVGIPIATLTAMLDSPP